MAQEDYDAWAEMDAELEKRNKAIEEFGYYNPLEDIYEEIEKTVSAISFGLCYVPTDDYVHCSSCASGKEKTSYISKFQHKDNNLCTIENLRSLVNTLGDMIA